jgi:hypothetical protein
MKYILALLLSLVFLILSYVIFLPYLLMSFRFEAHWEATKKSLEAICDWVNN